MYVWNRGVLHFLGRYIYFKNQIVPDNRSRSSGLLMPPPASTEAPPSRGTPLCCGRREYSRENRNQFAKKNVAKHTFTYSIRLNPKKRETIKTSGNFGALAHSVPMANTKKIGVFYWVIWPVFIVSTMATG